MDLLFFFNRGNPLTCFLADNKKEALRISAAKSWYILKVYLQMSLNKGG